MDYVINLVNKSLLDKRHLTDNEIIDVTENLIKYYQIGKYIDNIYIENNMQYGQAGYDVINKSIKYNIKSINEKVFYSYNSDITIKDKLTFNEYYLIEQLLTIFHELRHVLHEKMKDSNDTSIIKNILIECSYLIIMDYDEYLANHHILPNEKNARVFSFEECIKVLEKSNFPTEKMIYMYQFYMNELISGYNFYDGNNELKMFYNHFFDEDDISSNNLMSTHEKISYNMLISSEEQISLMAAYHMIKKGNNPKNFINKTLKKSRGK